MVSFILKEKQNKYKVKENRFIKVNKAFADVMGLSKIQIEGKSCIELYPKEQADAF